MCPFYKLTLSIPVVKNHAELAQKINRLLQTNQVLARNRIPAGIEAGRLIRVLKWVPGYPF
jgi:hypothetical protein